MAYRFQNARGLARPASWPRSWRGRTMDKTPKGRQVHYLPRRTREILKVLSNRDEPMGETDSPKAMELCGSHSVGWRFW